MSEIKNSKDYDRFVVVHYAEIGLKKKNRPFFEKRLVNNMKYKLKDLVEKLTREPGQISIKLSPGAGEGEVRYILEKIPGISHFSFSLGVLLELDNLKSAVLDFLKHREFDTFKIDTRRRDKTFHLDSMQLNQILGEAVCLQYNKKANMTAPDLRIKVEITRKMAYVSGEDIPGVGGLPVHPRQNVVALLSGGIDSPVASYLMMKRGCRAILIHFQNRQIITAQVEEKIMQLGEQLSRFQRDTHLYIVPFEPLQREIIMKVQAPYRMLIYRRFMIRIAAELAKRCHARYLVLGDNLSQVASQTYHNLAATYSVAPIPILSPLMGFDKKEIVDISRKIGTYSTSIQPYGDCCSFFLPQHPVLDASSRELDEMEKEFDLSALTEASLDDAKIITWP